MMSNSRMGGPTYTRGNIDIIIRSATITRMLNQIELANDTFIEGVFKRNRFYNIASGEEDNVIKMYFYGHVVVQLIIHSFSSSSLNPTYTSNSK